MIPERTPLFLMANLGAEVSRMLSAKEIGNIDLSRVALGRAEKLLTQIRAFPEMAPREIEISALEQAIRSVVETNPDVFVSPYRLKRYFAPFALRITA